MKTETKLVACGRNPESDCGSVNPPIHRTSTILFPNFEEMEAYERGASKHPGYARFSTPTTKALEDSLVGLDGSEHVFLTSSGLAAITTALMSQVSAGDHILMSDSVYGPARKFVQYELVRYGVEVTFYDPQIGSDIKSLMKPNTKLVYVEAPGSLTFEMQDIPAIAKAAHAAGATVVADCTWATPLFMKPFELGVDIAIHSATKYISGHSDLVMGLITCRKAHVEAIARTHKNLGACTTADNAFLAMRGLRTMALRLKEQEVNTLKICQWLQKRSEVKRVLYPALPDDPGHAIWKRDFSGAAGLFAVELHNSSKAATTAFMNALHHFGLGFSWGGYESLATAYRPAMVRSATNWQKDQFLIRLQVGLEHVDDLIGDLEEAFAKLAKSKAA